VAGSIQATGAQAKVSEAEKESDVSRESSYEAVSHPANNVAQVTNIAQKNIRIMFSLPL